jgi:hypothetical protein
MASATIPAVQYNGSLLAAQLLSGSQTLVLSSFGPGSSGTIVDNDGTLGTSDNGVATFNGFPITYIGSGTAQPGVNVLGVTVPLGAAVPVVVFSAGGHIYFSYPSGAPSPVGAVAVVITITTTPYHLFNPVCFAAGTLIATPDGERLVEELTTGDEVLDVDGAVHEVVWSGGRTVALPAGNHPWVEAWRPVVVPAGAFGKGQPGRDLVVSQQHRLLVQGAWPELMFGTEQILVPARALVGDTIRIDRNCDEVSYYHILCDRHVVLIANGMPAESLCPDSLTASPEGSRGEASLMFPELAGLSLGEAAPLAFPVARAHLAAALPV